MDISRSSFLRHFEDRQIHLEDLEPHLDAIKEQVLRANAGIPARDQISPDEFVARLRQGAGEDGIIRRDEFEAVFGLLDRIDRNGSSKSFAAFGAPGDAATSVRPSPAAEVQGILSRVRRNPHAVGLEKFKEVFAGGAIDTSVLRDQPDLRQVLVDAGIDMRAFDALADDDGTITGTANLVRLFRLIDRIDANGDGGSFDATAPTLAGEIGRASPAGMVVGALLRAHRPYDQQFRQYADLSSAAMATQGEVAVKNAKGRELRHQLQVDASGKFDSKGCKRACDAMVRSFDATLGRKIEHPSRTLVLSQAEDSAGALAGYREDFDQGRMYIDACLAQNRPVIVGLSRGNISTNAAWDRATDHFVVIRARGIDDAGRVYYEFADSSTSKEDWKIGRFYVDKDSGMLFRPPLEGPRGRIQTMDWQVSQVRPYTDLSIEDVIAAANADRAVRTLTSSQ